MKCSHLDISGDETFEYSEENVGQGPTLKYGRK